jgi:hypothetical protein
MDMSRQEISKSITKMANKTTAHVSPAVIASNLYDIKRERASDIAQ